MRITSLACLLTTAASAVILVSTGVIPEASRTLAQDAAKHKADDHHGMDMFRTTKSPKTIPVAASQLAVDRVQYTPLKSESPVEGEKDQTLVLFEGDIVLGTENELEQAATGRIVQNAQTIVADQGQAVGDLGLTKTQEDTLRSLAKIEVTPEAKAASLAARKAQVAKLLSQAALLGMDIADEKTHIKEIRGATTELRDELKGAAVKYSERLKGAFHLDEPNSPRVANAPTAGDDGIDVGGVQGTSMMVALVGPSGKVWPQGVIPFEFHPTFPSSQVTSVQQAIAHWHSKTTHIRFVAQGSLQHPANFPNKIVFIPATGCASRVGMKLSPGAQGVQLAGGCFTPQVIHELGHAVGLWHEQSRNDRDTFLQIQASNIDPPTLFNFDKVGASGADLGPFDFNSIMLYPPKSFSSTGLPTMVSKVPGITDFGIATGAAGGSTTGLSPFDVFGVETLYPAVAATNP